MSLYDGLINQLVSVSLTKDISFIAQLTRTEIFKYRNHSMVTQISVLKCLSMCIHYTILKRKLSAASFAYPSY